MSSVQRCSRIPGRIGRSVRCSAQAGVRAQPPLVTVVPTTGLLGGWDTRTGEGVGVVQKHPVRLSGSRTVAWPCHPPQPRGRAPAQRGHGPPGTQPCLPRPQAGTVSRASFITACAVGFSWVGGGAWCCPSPRRDTSQRAVMTLEKAWSEPGHAILPPASERPRANALCNHASVSP